MLFNLFMVPILAISCVRGFKYSHIDVPAETYSLPELPYPLDGLTPWVEAQTVDVHYNGHHKAYATNMNIALHKWREERPADKLHDESIVVILERLNEVPSEYRTAIKNHGGGYVNHLFYWSVMSPNTGDVARAPTGSLRDEIDRQFGSYDQFQTTFTNQAKSLFGSGYVWLVRNKLENGALEIISTANQDCPLTNGQYPILVIDVWEHAYYLGHKNKRPSYVESWWKVVDWEKVEELDVFWKNRNSSRDEL